MTTNRWTTGFIAAISLTAVLFCHLRASGETQQPLSKQQLHKLLRTSASAADKGRIAAYYRGEQKRFSEKAQAFAAEAAVYEKRPATMESKQGISCLCPAHFRYFAKYYAEEANKSWKLAEMHESAARREPVKP